MAWMDQHSWKDLVLMGTSRPEFTTHTWTGAHSYVSKASNLFLQCKNITFHTLEFVHQVGGFTVSRVGDGISQVGVKASE